MAWRGSPAGVREHGMLATGFSRNLGDPVVSVLHPSPRGARHQVPRPAGGALGARRERTPERKDGTRQAKETKPGGMGGRESERAGGARKRGK